MQRPTTEASGYAFGKPSKAGPADARRNNRTLIFSLLFPNNRLSRAELGRRTGLSRVAVSDVVSEMLDEGLIRESGQAPSRSKGKRGTLLSIDADRLRAISVDLSQAHLIRAAVTDLLGRPLTHAEAAVLDGQQITVDTICGVIEALPKPDGRIIGIGIATPGIVDDDGVVRASTNLGWRDLDLKTPIERRFDLPVTVDNDAIAAMMAERFFGQGGPNLLFVRVRRGIGSAILVDDTVVIGENHAAGEIAHISLEPQGPPCPCGKRGCLERLTSAPVIYSQLHDSAPDEHADILTGAARRLGQALAMPIGMFDLGDVCVYGPADIINDEFIDALQSHLDQTTDSAWRERTLVRRGQCGDDITIQGEAVAVIYRHIKRL
ncbi:NagC family transcriptional regulator [Bifidobacterium lemurum]|uniref:NagC family transcriptional regulator n=1 Tax=Bifidobacterium lemurum TaxID=1603886 RepID=A0A261FWK3_9BIFI|nr:ROK family transcriptional regulator [Bifidobacterium lemurum]OZG63498.1 NagC family transcriptional regulator [Bifidobacterium lemurum]QOL34409.1 ROK family transcriptional regulator [Bifidobacterium lemurum]